MREMLFGRVVGRREAMAQEGLLGTPWKSWGGFSGGEMGGGGDGRRSPLLGRG